MADGSGSPVHAGPSARCALVLVVAACTAIASWKVRRSWAFGQALAKAGSIVRRYEAKRTGATLEEMFDGVGVQGASGRNTLYENWTSQAKWYEPWKRLPFTPLLTCEPGNTLLMNRFDWKLVPIHAWLMPNATLVKERKPKGPVGCNDLDPMPFLNVSYVPKPRTVWAAAHGLDRLLEAAAAANLQEGREERVVVFSGNEMPLSRAFGATQAERVGTVERLRKYFGTIAFQVKDIEMEHVRVAPMGLCWGYVFFLFGAWINELPPLLRSPDHMANRFRGFDEILRRSVDLKDRGVLAVGPVVATWLDNPATTLRVANYTKQGKLFPPSNSSLNSIYRAYLSRREMREWLSSSQAQAVGAEYRNIPKAEWYHELSRYRFLLSPIGSAIQTAKTIEALLMLTVPIVQRMSFPTHDELVGLGFPIVVVESWSEITPNTTSAWWSQLAPRLESFRRNCLTVEGYWHMFTGRTPLCY